LRPGRQPGDGLIPRPAECSAPAACRPARYGRRPAPGRCRPASWSSTGPVADPSHPHGGARRIEPPHGEAAVARAPLRRRKRGGIFGSLSWTSWTPDLRGDGRVGKMGPAQDQVVPVSSKRWPRSTPRSTSRTKPLVGFVSTPLSAGDRPRLRLLGRARLVGRPLRSGSRPQHVQHGIAKANHVARSELDLGRRRLGCFLILLLLRVHRRRQDQR